MCGRWEREGGALLRRYVAGVTSTRHPHIFYIFLTATPRRLLPLLLEKTESVLSASRPRLVVLYQGGQFAAMRPHFQHGILLMIG